MSPNPEPMDSDLTVAPSFKSKPTGPKVVETVTLFVVDDREFKAPTVLAPSIGIRYLREVRRHGHEVAVVGVMDDLFGTDAIDFLMSVELDPEDFESAKSVMERYMLGVLEGKVPQRRSGPTGSKRARPKSAG